MNVHEKETNLRGGAVNETIKSGVQREKKKAERQGIYRRLMLPSCCLPPCSNSFLTLVFGHELPDQCMRYESARRENRKRMHLKAQQPRTYQTRRKE